MKKEEKKIPTCAIYIHIYTFPYCEWVDLICGTAVNGMGLSRLGEKVLTHLIYSLVVENNKWQKLYLHLYKTNKGCWNLGIFSLHNVWLCA